MSPYFAGLGWKHIRYFSQQNAGFFVLQFFVNPAKTAGLRIMPVVCTASKVLRGITLND